MSCSLFSRCLCENVYPSHRIRVVLFTQYGLENSLLVDDEIGQNCICLHHPVHATCSLVLVYLAVGLI